MSRVEAQIQVLRAPVQGASQAPNDLNKPSNKMAGRASANPAAAQVSSRGGLTAGAAARSARGQALHRQVPLQRRAVEIATGQVLRRPSSSSSATGSPATGSLAIGSPATGSSAETFSPATGVYAELARTPIGETARKEVKKLLSAFEKGSVDDKMAAQVAKKIETTGRFSKPDRVRFQKNMNQNLKQQDYSKQLFTRFLKVDAHELEVPRAAPFLRPVTEQQFTEAKVWNSLDQVFDYTEAAEKDLAELGTLSNKLNKTGKLTGKEQKKFNQLLWTHKENIPILQAHLVDLRESMPENLGMVKVLDSAITALADKHMALADLMSLHTDHLPERPATSRDERLDFHLLQAQAGREVLTSLRKSCPDDPQKLRALDKIDMQLAQHIASLAQLKDKMIPQNPDDLALLLDMPISKADGVSPKAKKELEKGWARGLKLPAGRRDMTQEQMINLFLNHQLKSAGFNMRNLPSLKFLQEQGYLQAINKKPWPKIDNEIRVKLGGDERSFRSVITPSAVHSDRLAQPYRGSGVGSSDRLQYDHAVNLARTSFTNDRGQELFSAHRSGVLDAYDMTPKKLAQLSNPELQGLFQSVLVDRGRRVETSAQLVELFHSKPAEARRLAKEARQETSKAMAEDTAATMLLDDPALLERALQGELVELPITSLSLMTPDHLRELGGKSSEQTMLTHHKEGLESLRNNGLPIKLKLRSPVDGKLTSVRVQVRPRVLSFGVNAGALRGVGVVKGNRLPFWKGLMGWGLSARLNDPVLNHMVGKRSDKQISGQAADKIKQLQIDQNHISQMLKNSALTSEAHGQLQHDLVSLQRQEAKITQLADQVKTIWAKGSYVREGREPYKMPARVVMLADALGEKTLFHCKSGKDRTGQLDAEVKYLSAVFDQTGILPAPDQPPRPATRRLRTLFALKTGNHEMQRYNTGLAGFKLKGVPALDAQFERSALPTYRGGSAYIKS